MRPLALVSIAVLEDIPFLKRWEDHLQPLHKQAGQELLILGDAGAGKSTLLLELAQHLLTQSEQDHKETIPVIFPLSTWATNRPHLQNWLIDEFIRIYPIPKELSSQWIEADAILPLLDGLDEMDEDARPMCIAAINAYHRDHLRPLVVCSRTDEYEHTTATTSEQLALNAAVVVQPLSPAQVDTYLATLDRPLPALRSALNENATLTALATTPLMLQILTQTDQETTIQRLPHKKTELEPQIGTTYVQQMGKRKENVALYPYNQTLSWLHWLAQSMRKHNQTIFSLEDLQPDILPLMPMLLYYLCVGLLVELLVGLSFGLFGGLIGGLIGEQFGGLGGLCLGLLIGGLCFLHGMKGKKIKLTITGISWKRWCLALLFGLGSGLLYFEVVGLDAGLIGGLIIGLNAMLSFGSLGVLPKKQLTELQRLTPNEGIRRSFLSGVGVILLFGLQLGTIIGLLVGIYGGLQVGLQVGLLLGLNVGLVGGLIEGLTTAALLFDEVGAREHCSQKFSALLETVVNLRRSALNEQW